jgi:hypothetical protein
MCSSRVDLWTTTRYCIKALVMFQIDIGENGRYAVYEGELGTLD